MRRFSTIYEATGNETLVIVDVQGEFGKFIQGNLVEELFKFASGFGDVYQVWDSNKASGATYTFPNQKGCYVKKYGTTFSRDLQAVTKQIGSAPVKEGERFKFKDIDSYIVRVKNNHGWFYIPEELAGLFKSLSGKTVVLVGGADGECLKDVFEAMESFGISVRYEPRYIYSAKTRSNDKV